MVSRLACSRCAVNLSLDAVVAHPADGKGAALHEEVFVGVDAVAYSLQHVEGAVLHRHVFARLDAMLHISIDVQRTLALELGMAFHHEAGLLVAAGAVGQRVLRVLLCADVYALAVLDVDGSTTVNGVRIGQRQSVQLDGSLVGARQIELTVGRRARERIGDFAHIVVAHVCALYDAYVGSADGGGHVLGHVAGHIDRCRLVAILHAHRVVRHFTLVDVGLGNVSRRERLAHDGERRPFAVVHVAHLCSRKLVDGVAHHHVHRLRLCCEAQHQGCYHC